MKVVVGLVLAVLVASVQTQQMITFENCVFDIGVVIADLSLVYKDRTNAQYISKAKADVQTLNDQCLAVLPVNLSAAPKVSCDKLLYMYKTAVVAKNAKALDILKTYHQCLSSSSA